MYQSLQTVNASWLEGAKKSVIIILFHAATYYDTTGDCERERDTKSLYCS